jgi:hypothetical protein
MRSSEARRRSLRLRRVPSGPEGVVVDSSAKRRRGAGAADFAVLGLKMSYGALATATGHSVFVKNRSTQIVRLGFGREDVQFWSKIHLLYLASPALLSILRPPLQAHASVPPAQRLKVLLVG